MRVLVAASLVFLLAAPAARADIFAVADGTATDTSRDFDIVMVDASTGARVMLPSTIDTAADETHPSISADGTRLVFQRYDGATRIVLASLPSGTLTDLFNGIEQATNVQIAPSISSDGTTVLTGEVFQHTSVGLASAITLTDLSGALAQPFPHTQYSTQYAYGSGTQSGISSDAALSGNLLAWTSRQSGGREGMILAHRDGGAALPEFTPAIGYSHPALGSPGATSIVVFNERATGEDGDIVFRTTDPLAPRLATDVIRLPPIVNTPRDENTPAFTADSRYLGFLRFDGRHSLVFVWDTETQTLINLDGADVGAAHRAPEGNLSLFVRPLIKVSALAPRGLITFNLLSPAGVGILVQRIAGRQTLLGRTVPKLVPVGRVPLGKFKKGRGKVRWNGRVAGKRLRPGRYQVTVRAVSPRGEVLDLGHPHTLTVR